MGLEEKASGFIEKVKEDPLQVVKYLASYGGATALSYAIGAASAYHSQEQGCNPESIATLSFTAKTATFYLANIAIYTASYWNEYQTGARHWRKDMDEAILSNMGGTGVTLAGGGLHWALMRTINLSPISSFIFGNLIPGVSAALVKVIRDAKKGILVR
ncbi:MAG: hypothetical protein Q8Q31_05930 [Nanoarchaeota archaeon]|nr:hypothetical protein [Nanoarchaeota archaeon]